MGTIEERLAALESRVQELSARSAPASPWWRDLAGKYAGDPDFAEAARLGREWRHSLDA